MKEFLRDHIRSVHVKKKGNLKKLRKKLRLIFFLHTEGPIFATTYLYRHYRTFRARQGDKQGEHQGSS